MKDGLLRSSIKFVVRLGYLCEVRIRRRLRRSQREFKLAGHCSNCGACCETPAVQMPPLLLRFKSIRGAVVLWQKWVNGFELIGRDRKHGILIFRCTHFDPDTKLCDSYGTRPGACRDYPRNLLDDPLPEFPEACTFHAVSRNAQRIRDSLADLDLAPEELAKLEATFYAKDDAKL
jgi:Fe-S-cluster containining protein